MKGVIYAVLVVAAISLILGIISRFSMTLIPIAPGGGIEAEVLLSFSNTCFLAAIALTLLEILKSKQ